MISIPPLCRNICQPTSGVNRRSPWRHRRWYPKRPLNPEHTPHSGRPLPGSISSWHPLHRALNRVKDCPKCRLVNPDSALRCDCGYDFPSGQMQSSYLADKDKLLRETSIGVLAGGFLIWGIFRVVSSFAHGVLPGLISAGLLFLVLAYYWPRYFSRASRR